MVWTLGRSAGWYAVSQSLCCPYLLLFLEPPFCWNGFPLWPFCPPLGGGGGNGLGGCGGGP